jgi:hypothetical protein
MTSGRGPEVEESIKVRFYGRERVPDFGISLSFSL